MSENGHHDPMDAVHTEVLHRPVTFSPLIQVIEGDFYRVIFIDMSGVAQTYIFDRFMFSLFAGLVRDALIRVGGT